MLACEDKGSEGDEKVERNMAEAGELDGKDGGRELGDEERKLDGTTESGAVVGDSGGKPRARLKRRRKPTGTRARSKEKALHLHSDISANSVDSSVAVQPSDLSPPSTDTDRGDDPAVPEINHLTSAHDKEAAVRSPTTEVPVHVPADESRQTEYDFPASTSDLELGKPLLPSDTAVTVDCDGRLSGSVELLLCKEGGGGELEGESDGSHTLLDSEENVSAACERGGSVLLMEELEKDKGSAVGGLRGEKSIYMYV